MAKHETKGHKLLHFRSVIDYIFVLRSKKYFRGLNHSLKNGTQEWLQKTSEVISVHGMAWYTRSESRKIKALVVFFSGMYMICAITPTFL